MTLPANELGIGPGRTVLDLAALPDARRAEVLDGVRAIVASEPSLDAHGELAMPYITHVAWCRARRRRTPRR